MKKVIKSKYLLNVEGKRRYRADSMIKLIWVVLTKNYESKKR